MGDSNVRSIDDGGAATVTQRRAEVDALGRELIGLAGRLSAATCTWLLLVADFHAREGCAVWGYPSTVRWLMHHCGLARRTAVEHVRVGAALVEHPALAEAMGAGRLSYSQVRAISRVSAIAGPELIDALIMTAQHGTIEQLEFAVRGLRTVDDAERSSGGGGDRAHHTSTGGPVGAPVGEGVGSPAVEASGDEPDAGEHVGMEHVGTDHVGTEHVGGEWIGSSAALPSMTRPAESWRQRWDDDSRWRASARLQPEHGAMIDAALASLCEREDIGRPAALVRMAEIALAVIADADGALPALRGEERAAVVVHLHTTLDAGELGALDSDPAAPDAPARSAERADRSNGVAGTVAAVGAAAAQEPRSAERAADPAQRTSGEVGRIVTGGLYGHLLHGPGLPRRALRRLMCEGRVRTVLLDRHGSPLDLGRSHRLVTAKQFAALLLRDGGCAHPGCGRRTRLEAHHVRHWLEGGLTNLANLVLLCEAHHHAHHEREFSILALGRGRFRFLRADGRTLERVDEPARLGSEPGPDTAAYDRIAATAASSRWDGTRLDRQYAIAVLAQGLRKEAA